MQWFDGPIHDAIAAAKKERKIFLVFVEGKDETSKNMTEKITEKDISDPLNENCVSIKLTTDSEAFRQFSQIYPVIVVPSMFFIGNNGIPLEVIAGSENQDDFSLKVGKAIQLHKSKVAEAAAFPTSTPTTTTASAGPSSATTTVQVEEQSIGQSSMTTPEAAAAAPVDQKTMDGSDQVTLEEAQALLKQKMERAEQLIAERRRIREQEDKEAEKQRELEQRRVSREIQKAREQMKDKEMADWAKQRQKEKQEDKEARQRVLAQIAQDKADRAAKLQNSGGSTAPAAVPSSTSSVRQRSPQDTASNSEMTRIQFRLPNSVTCSHEFPSRATLRDVMHHVQQEIKPDLSGFSLATSFPRRHFSKADHVRTLQDLDLSPSAVLLVLPASAANPAQNSGGGGLWALFWTILSPLTLVWNFIYSFIFGNRTGPALPSSSPQSQRQPEAGQQKSADTSRNKSGPDQKAQSPNSSRYRKDGNIHRLSNESSNDDEDGTWNGNSTQQM